MQLEKKKKKITMLGRYIDVENAVKNIESMFAILSGISIDRRYIDVSSRLYYNTPIHYYVIF